MNELIKLNEVKIANESVQTVNARELHAFLESKQKFTTWIQKRIEDYGFTEGMDFVRTELPAGYAAGSSGGGLADILSSQKSEALKTSTYDFGQQGRIEYSITLDMAKELAMVERNEKGRQARRYFIECEKQLRQVKTTPAEFQPSISYVAEMRKQAELLDRFANYYSGELKDYLRRQAVEKLLGHKVELFDRKLKTAEQISRELDVYVDVLVGWADEAGMNHEPYAVLGGEVAGTPKFLYTPEGEQLLAGILEQKKEHLRRFVETCELLGVGGRK